MNGRAFRAANRYPLRLKARYLFARRRMPGSSPGMTGQRLAPAMSDIVRLEQEIIGAIDAAGDEAALDAARVAALGKKGSVSELLKTLGAMSPEERKQNGSVINSLKDRV